MKKELKIVMLPVKGAGIIQRYVKNCFGRYLDNQPLVFNKNRLLQNDSGEGKTEYYELYIISDEEVKEGDYHIAMGLISSHPFQCIAYTDEEQLEAIKEMGNAKKIIATTDKLLGLESKGNIQALINPFPRIAESFTEDYVKYDNENNPITSVYLEVDDNYLPNESNKEFLDNSRIKINKDNTVIITKTIHGNKLYSKNDIINIIKQSIHDECDGTYNDDMNSWNFSEKLGQPKSLFDSIISKLN